MGPWRQVLLAWSGGKDAAWALHVLRQRGDWEVVGLLATVVREDGRASMQGVRGEVLRAQAAAAGLPLLEAGIPAHCDNATYDAAMAGVLDEAEARWPGLRADLCCVDTPQLDARSAGVPFDASLLDALPAGVDPCGENGEFHTCAWDGPMFGAPLSLHRGDTCCDDGRFARTDFTLARRP